MGGGSSTYLFLDETAGGDYIDTVPSGELGNELNSYSNEPPPKGLIIDTEFNSLLVGHIEHDNVLRFSKEIYVDAWSSLETISLDSTIIRVSEFNGQLIVLCTTSVYRVTGTNIDNFQVAKVPTNQGCLNYKSVVESKGMLLWQSVDGICAFDGASVSVISYNKLKKKEFAGRNLSGVAMDEDVFFADSQGIIAVDIARGLSWREFDVPNDIRGMFYSHKLDRIFSSDGTVTNTLFNNPNKKLHILYKTGEISLESLVSLKSFKKVHLFGKGRFNVQLKVDGGTEVIDIEVDLAKEPKEVNLPSGTRGRYIEFLLQGQPQKEEDESVLNAIIIEYEIKGLGK